MRYLKLDLLVLAFWQLSRQCRLAHWKKKLYFETNKGKFTNWCELPLEHLPPPDRSVLALALEITLVISRKLEGRKK